MASKQNRRTVSIQLSDEEIALSDELTEAFSCSRAAIFRLALAAFSKRLKNPIANQGVVTWSSPREWSASRKLRNK